MYAPFMKKDKEVYDKVCEYLSPHLNKDMEVLELACGVRPFLSDKFNITKHKNYKLLEDYDKKNLFDVEEYLTNRDKVKLKSSYKINRLNI
ncbi:hypothetical protein [Enterococcus faecalis]|uniref:hypothetical protein n=1 Tax=Enterococcus faecalis TaxID=1351 RepID=UPI003F69AB5C